MNSTDKSDRYHHGQLRRSLLDAALQLVEQTGVNNLSLREVARQAGVSHMAPYNHFANKAALVDALVAECFARFGDALQAAAAQATGSAIDAFGAVGVAYVDFAVQHPEAFRLMCRPELRQEAPDGSLTRPAPSQAAWQEALAFRMLIDSIARCQHEGYMPAGDLTALAVTAWSTVHGLALLILDGGLQTQFIAAAGEPQDLADIVTRQLLTGLLIR